MSEMSKAGRRPDVLRWLIMAAIVVGVVGVLYVIGAALIKPSAPAGLADLKKGALAKLEIPKAPPPVPTAPFQDTAGKTLTLADFKGRVVVVNFWATWCGPCVLEMPTLSRLAATYDGQPVAVVPISIDKDDAEAKARAFIAKNRPLAFYRDPAGAMPFVIQPAALGLPTTIIYDKKGVERARLSGGADWSGPEAAELVRVLLAE
jgi:thiol-disulfide isomerase/thioredoxin